MPEIPATKTPATQRDIAKALNLSQTAVAFALNPKYSNKLPSETVALIQSKAEEMRYRPQQIAKIFRTKRSYTIAVVLVSANLQAPQERVKLLAQHAIKAGYQMIAIDLDWFDRDEAAAREYLLNSTAEGVIFCNISSNDGEKWIQTLKERSLPFVSLNSPLPVPFDEAAADIREAFRQMTLHHLEIGARRPMLLLSYRDADYAGPIGPSIRDRVEGFASAILEAGGRITMDDFIRDRLGKTFVNHGTGASGSVDARVIYPAKPTTVKDSFELGYWQIEQFIRENAVPDSLICSNDEIAMGALAACAQHRIAVPEALRVSGADNSRFSRFGAVPLTTIQQPSQAMVEWSIQRIAELIENPKQRAKCQKKVFACQILPRQSTIGIVNP